MLPSPSPNPRPTPSPIPNPTLEMRRALRHLLRTGKLDYFDTPYRDRERNRRQAANRRSYLNRRTKIQRTNAQPLPVHNSTTPLLSSAGLEVYIHKDKSDSVAEPNRRPYWMHPMVMANREEREAAGVTPVDYGKRWKAAFRAITGGSPACGPGDRAAARVYLGKILLALEQEGWTPGENGQLHRLEKRWRARAEGRDARFEVVGTYNGCPTREQRKLIHDKRILLEMARLARGENNDRKEKTSHN